MSRHKKYDKPFLTTLWAEYQKSGQKLKEYCKNNNLNYISIYSALRREEVMRFIKKNKTNTAAQEVETKETAIV